MAFATSPGSGAMGEMNTTPLIDVMLVLLVMFIITIPVATHSVDIDLPSDVTADPPPLSPVRNKIVVTGEGRLLWNGQSISDGTLASLLQESRTLAIEPELQLEPEAGASYDLTARTLRTIKASGVTKFGFVGNERYRDFSAG